MKSTKLYFIGMGVLAAFAVFIRFFDAKLAELLYKSGNFVGGLCETLGRAIPFALCAFCFAALIFCRHTRTTRTKNKILSIILGVATLIASVATVYFPLHNHGKINYFAVIGAAAVLTALFIYLGATLFKTNYQKSLMTKFAKSGLFSAAASLVICFAASFLPQRASHSALLLSMEKFGNYDSPESFVPFIVLSGIGTSLVMWITCFADIFPKLKFAKKYLFAFSVIFAVFMLFGSVTSGDVYASEFIYSLAVGYTSLFICEKIADKKE